MSRLRRSRLAGAGRATVRALVRLVLDDGFVFTGTLLALVTAWVLSRPSLLGPSTAVGWLLFALVASALVGSLRRATRGDRADQRRPPGPPTRR